MRALLHTTGRATFASSSTASGARASSRRTRSSSGATCSRIDSGKFPVSSSSRCPRSPTTCSAASATTSFGRSSATAGRSATPPRSSGQPQEPVGADAAAHLRGGGRRVTRAPDHRSGAILATQLGSLTTGEIVARLLRDFLLHFSALPCKSLATGASQDVD
jgi:hypothetical protein